MSSQYSAAALPFPPKPSSEATIPEEILWLARTAEEGEHRRFTHWRMVNPYRPDMALMDRLPPMDDFEFADACNKMVPLATRLPEEFYPLSPYTFNSLLPMNNAICERVEVQRAENRQQIASNYPRPARPLAYGVESQVFRLLQPLYRALIMVISGDSYSNEDSKAVKGLPVTIIRTGVEDGLSAPIDFDSIADSSTVIKGLGAGAVRTTLETAITFVMDLEARETTAFGLQPDPVTSWESGWLEGRWTCLNQEPPHGPSSGWVDTSRIVTWAGCGEKFDSVYMNMYEDRAFRFQSFIDTGKPGILTTVGFPSVSG